MARRLFILAVVSSSLTAAIIAQPADGILITQRVTSAGAPLTIQLQLQATRMRTEMAGPDGVTNVTIFDGGKGVRTEVIEAGRRAFSDLLFAVPAGFTKQNIK